MITKWINFINKKNVILGSGSPARKKIFEELGIKFTVKTSNYPEDLSKENISPSKYVEQTCINKFNYFVEKNTDIKYDILVTADSIVEFKDKIIEKPKNKDECREWFKAFSNNKILAHTYMCVGVIENNKCVKMEKYLTTTSVIFDTLSDDDIEAYISTPEPYNKAGGFSIQGSGKVLIKGIEGDYYNVVGFPVNSFCHHLTKVLSDVYGEKGYEK